MSGKLVSLSERMRIAAAVALLCAFTSCAGKQDVSSDAPSLPVSEAALLSDGEDGGTSADTNVFSGLNPSDAGAAAMTVSETSAASSDGSGPFYNAVGGESLGRVAYTLYGDRNWKKTLKPYNSDLSGGKLASGQRVFFEFAGLKPQPMFLTKDLIDRYANELADKMKSGDVTGQSTITVQPGETLQKLSARLYGTTRYWTEIYLLNREKLKGYDSVSAGITLVVQERGLAQTSPAKEEVPAPVFSEKPSRRQAPAPAPVEEIPAPIVNTQPEAIPPAVQPAMDPIPETPASAPAPVASKPLAQSVPEKNVVSEMMSESGNANTRRMLYVSLIVLIGSLAFYFTRTGKRQKIDMLDVTAGSTAIPPRSKLPSAPKGSDQHKNIG